MCSDASRPRRRPIEMTFVGNSGFVRPHEPTDTALGWEEASTESRFVMVT